MHAYLLLIPITFSYITLTIIALRSTIAPIPLALVLLALTFTSLLAIVGHFAAHRILRDVYFAIHSQSFYLRTQEAQGWGSNTEASHWPPWEQQHSDPQQDFVDSIPTPADWTLTD